MDNLNLFSLLLTDNRRETSCGKSSSASSFLVTITFELSATAAAGASEFNNLAVLQCFLGKNFTEASNSLLTSIIIDSNH